MPKRYGTEHGPLGARPAPPGSAKTDLAPSSLDFNRRLVYPFASGFKPSRAVRVAASVAGKSHV